MFKITLMKKEDTQKTAQYLGYESKGITLVCYEENEITGAVCFDIINGIGYIQKIKADDPKMKPVVGSAALNFLEFHNIFDVYANDEEDTEFYKSLGFIETEDIPNEIEGQYAAHLNLEGYFNAH